MTDQEILRCWALGLSAYDMAQEYAPSAVTVARRLKAMGKMKYAQRFAKKGGR
jgi:hypothetical protein